MPNFYSRRQERTSLILGLLLSLLIHGAIASYLARYKTKELVAIEEESLTPITIIELAEPKPEASLNTSSSDIPSKSPPASQTAAPKTPIEKPTPPPKIEPSPTPPISPAKPATPIETTETKPKIEPTTTAAKPELPQSNENPTPPVSPPPAKPETKVDRPTVKPKPKPIEPIEQKPLVANKPVKTPELPPLKPLPKKRSPDNLDRDRQNSESTAASDSDTPFKTERITEEANPSDTIASETNTPSQTNETTENTNTNDTAAANNAADESPAPLSIACKDNCQPEYPDRLDGIEGTTGIQLTIDRDGKVIDAAIAVSSGNSLVDEEALEAAKQMEFNEIDRDRAIVQINLSFAVADEDEW